ncbi:MAG: hypothetical protein ACXQS8_06235, partial [Candidatus Helarchaeales archaeon]
MMNKKDYVTSEIASILGVERSPYFDAIELKPDEIDKAGEFLSGKVSLESRDDLELPELTPFFQDIENRIRASSNFPLVKKWYWPNFNSHAIVLSHDIDKISAPNKHVWKIRKRFSLFKVILHQLHLLNLYDNFAQFERLEKKRGIRSSFYVLL